MVIAGSTPTQVSQTQVYSYHPIHNYFHCVQLGLRASFIWLYSINQLLSILNSARNCKQINLKPCCIVQVIKQPEPRRQMIKYRSILFMTHNTEFQEISSWLLLINSFFKLVFNYIKTFSDFADTFIKNYLQKCFHG